MSSPPPPLSSLSLPPFFCSTAPQAFFRPDRVLSRPARADSCQGWPLFSGHPSGAPAFTAIEHDGRFDGSVDKSCLLLIRLRVSAFGRSCYEVHGACDVRINLYPAAPIRLAKVLLAWTIAQEGWDSSLGRQIGKCRFAMRSYSHTSDPPDTPETGVSELSRRYRVRIAPRGTRPCSR